jgi:valyl-tRNA synthetase
MKLGKTYEPVTFEADIYKLWEAAKAFEPKNRGGKGSFSIVVPPPNANGNLHLGHGLTLALEDMMIRYQRMQGKATLFLPGADHAGFETQSVYEKELAKEGKSRFDFSRDELYKQIWDFVAQNKDNYESQFRKLGASLDWSRYVYTLDPKIVEQAHKTFKKMWDDGLIYRGERLVNYCTFHGTGFADIEVEYKNEKSHLWHIRYPLTDGSGEVVVATTRPETMFGDVAVAVHPNDKRYKKFIGKTVKLPLTDREIPILADEMVETEFGTGAVKITPAHDQNDYEVAERHDLPMITVIDFDGTMNHDAPEAYRGMLVKLARDATVSDLKEQGYLVKEEPYEHSVGHCYKCGTVIQPLLREQWFIDIKPLAKPAIVALKDKKITFYPDSKRVQLIRYYEGLRDWNISRQIAWGIPIPAFQSLENPEDWIFDDRVDQEIIEVAGKSYRRDPDVFDTWFSSSSWPYATLDFPDGKDFNEFYPLSLMETAADILYPWVSRMIMFGVYNTGKLPFKETYLHGLILDEKGAKMSKSKGNVLDPMEMVDEFGSDAFRMGIIADESAGNNRPYDRSKVIGARNFCNKLWNIARFIESIVGDAVDARAKAEPASIADHWMLSKLQHSTERITADLDRYRFAEAYDELYHLVWDDFADWYIEASKVSPNPAFLAYCLETILKLAHPFAPFLTETIWQTLAWEKDSILAVAHWPEVTTADDKQSKAFAAVQTLVTETRSINSNLKKPVRTAHTLADNPLAAHVDLVDQLAKVTLTVQTAAPEGLQIGANGYSLWLEMDEASLNDLKDTFAAKIENLKREVKALDGRLSNESYVANAPEKLVTETKQQLADRQVQLEAVKTDLTRLTQA